MIMVQHFFKYLISIILLTLVSCGGSNNLDIKGEPDAIHLAEEMLKALGGKKAWQRVQSVYVRTIARRSSESEPYIYEEWTNLDEPKFMNRKSVNNTGVIEIVDGNDGWRIEGSDMQMIPPQRITSYLAWHDQYFMRVVKLIAMETESIEVRVKNENQLEVFVDDRFVYGFELSESFLPERYYTKGLGESISMVFFKKYSEYEGYKFPLEINSESMMATYTTDYFDPSPLEAEKAFNISFNPNELIKR
jgi:hypothetical protein